MKYLVIKETLKPFESLKLLINPDLFIDDKDWRIVDYFDDRVIRIRIYIQPLDKYIFKINCNDWIKGEKYIEVP